MIDPRLQTLRVLRDQGTVTATARSLHLTPSTVSQQLRHLSREVGVPLLEAEGRRVRLTGAAHTLLGHADTLFAEWERARADLAAHQEGAAGHVRICGVSSAVAALVAPAVVRLQAAHPGLGTHISEEESDDCFPLLLSGRADLAVLIPTADSPPPGDRRFDQRPLLDEPQDLLVPEAHPLAARGHASLVEAAHEHWIASPERADQYRLLLAACASAGFTPHVAHEAREWFAISALVAHGFGVCLVPRLAPIPPEHAVRRVRLTGTPQPSRRLITCVRRGSREQPPIARALEALHTVVGERTGD
ncbi:LysR family transcriptional regulator [Nocardiopsis sp. TSRI0078]|uniref:LysR family transcriptional regulator n=1 Tax=unclassified Nocardiopsis TaxID=2649073 RepID=UPI00093AFC60|nr:LysR family transcriptional regulator [Nocardiopsis sp. TSRI0078]OKI21924.1 LysR family transcriptional regulator [Nocardiopsis sp. TSRI0078]